MIEMILFTFVNKFRSTMRSIHFIQFFTVTELIRLKLVHPTLNNILNSDTINSAIQIGNLNEYEHFLYLKSFTWYTLEMVYKMCPASMIDMIKNSNDSTIFIIKNIINDWLIKTSKIKHNANPLNLHMPNQGMDSKNISEVPSEQEISEYNLKIIAHLFIHNKLYKIYDNSWLEAMVFVIQSLVQKYFSISIEDNTSTIKQWFETILFNLANNTQDQLLKILESFCSGGWTRVYNIIINMISLQIEKNKFFSFEGILDDIKQWIKGVDILTVGIPDGHSRFKDSCPEIIITSEEIEAYEHQFLLSRVIK